MENRVPKLEADIATILSSYATRGDIAELRADMHKATVEVQRWMITTIIGLFVGFGGMFLAIANAVKPGAAAVTPTPIIITVPSAEGEPAPAPRK